MELETENFFIQFFFAQNGENLSQKNQWMLASKNSEKNSKALGFRVVVGGKKKG